MIVPILRASSLLLPACLAMTANAGDYFPPDYKVFPFAAGDLLVGRRSHGKFAVNKVLKVDRVEIERGKGINIQGQKFIATETDFLLIVSESLGADEFDSFADARAAALSGRWTTKLGHAPNRAPGAAAGQALVGHAPVLDSELSGYRAWRQAFDNGEAGIF